MIDDFMTELFGGPASFSGRFGAAPAQPKDISALYGGGAQAFSRPPASNVAGILDGSAARFQPPAGGFPGGGVAPEVLAKLQGAFAPRPPAADSGISRQDAVGLLNGNYDIGGARRARETTPNLVMAGADPVEEAPARGVLGRLMGQTAAEEKRLQSVLAGGFAGGDPAFAGGAFMKGASGGLAAGLKNDKADADAVTAAEAAALKQENTEADRGLRERQVAEVEQTGEARRNLIALQGEQLRTGAGKATRDKPPADIATAEWLIEKGIAASPEAAWNLVRRSRSNPEQIAAQIMGRGLSPEHGRRNLNEYYKMFPHLRPDGGQPAPRSDAPAQVGPRAEVPSTARVVGDREAVQRGLYDPIDQPGKAAAKLPTRPQGVPPDAGFSASRGMWFTRDGRAFDASGRPVSR